MSLPVLYTPQEVAALWKVTRRTVYEWIKAGRIKAFRIGDTVRVPEAEMLAFLKPVEVAPRHAEAPKVRATKPTAKSRKRPRS